MTPKRQQPTREQRVEWVWKPIEDLEWSRKKRADMTPAEQEFVEAAVLDDEGNYTPDLERMKSLLAEHPPIDKVTDVLAENGANINAQDDKGRTPLHLAIYGGYKDAAEQLMALGADTTIRNKRGKNALEVARMACLYLKPKPAKGKKSTSRR